MEKSWLWDSKKSEEEVRQILREPSHASFLHYATLLFSRSNMPKEVFARYMSKEVFCQYWQQIKKRMRQDKWNQDRIVFWEEIYKHLSKTIKAQGIAVRPVRVKPASGSLQREVGEAIKTLRLAGGMTQLELARKAGVHQQVISKIEKGLANPSLKTIEKIKKHLSGSIGISIIELPVFSVNTSYSG